MADGIINKNCARWLLFVIFGSVDKDYTVKLSLN